MVPRAWNLHMYFLRVAIHIIGRRKRNPAEDFNFLIPCTCSSPMTMKNCADFFMLPSPVQKPIYILPSGRFLTNEKEAEPSVFIEEIRAGFDLPVEKIVLTGTELIDFQFLLLK